ncbi:MAG TPA: DUF1631 domain-containing protein [Usitatibacter sp.]|nr:DUF1631 domain-containing protein [Usitatibacter sp.]
MAQAANGNVVALGDHPRARARLTPQESASLLTGCRDLALDRMTAALTSMLNRVEDELFDLAQASGDRDTQGIYLDARAQARENRPMIDAAFRKHFVDCFDRKVRGERAGPRSAPAELSLVDEEDLEEDLAVTEMARREQAACEAELGALSQRMGFLLEQPALEDDANPVSPATICAALRQAFGQVQAGFKVRMALLRQLERHTQAEVQRIYHELNEHLVQKRVLPDVQAGRRAPAVPARREEPRAPAKDAPPAAPNDLFGSLMQLLGASMSPVTAGGSSVHNASVGNAAPAQPQPGAPAWPLAPGANLPPPPAALMSELTRMHRDGGPELAQAPSGALVNVVKAVKSAQGASLGAVDAMTIDIVAMLFDYIFDDRSIPASVKALLGRLQIPMLKVALLDKAFFSSKSHPARRLLDLLAEASLGLDQSTADGGATLAMVERVVARVLEGFETDMAFFSALVAEVEAFLEAQKHAEQNIVERSARLIEAREREEIARMSAEEEVTRRLALRHFVPPAVRAMLAGPWMNALADVHLTEGEGSPSWQGLTLTMDDLLWSVEPKNNLEERKRLVAMLPAMLRQLHDGLARAKAPDFAKEAFFGALVDSHAAAMKAARGGMAAAEMPPAPPAPPPIEAMSLESEVIPAGDIRVEEIRLRTARGTQVRNVFTRTGIWTNLQRGCWVEFTRPGHEAMRARLTWISPNKGVYLFTNPLSQATALSISPEALAEQMRLRHARILGDSALMDRAVDSMIATLKRA